MQLTRIFSASLLLLAAYCACVAAYGLPDHLHHAPENLSGLRASFEEHKWMQDSLRPSRKVLQLGSPNELLLANIRIGDLPAVERLLNEGADPNYTNEKGIDALGVAIVNDYSLIVTLLISRGADPGGAPGSATQSTGSLQLAAVFDTPKAAGALIQAGVPVDGFNSFGSTALRVAAFEGSVRVAEVLLDAGASVNIVSRNDAGSMPLHSAAAGKHLSMVRLLLFRGADINARSINGLSPLHTAVQANSGVITLELINKGADLEAKGADGITPLFDAAILGSKAAMEVLVENGANKSATAFNATPREALCACTGFDTVPEICNVDECRNPERMAQLLT